MAEPLLDISSTKTLKNTVQQKQVIHNNTLKLQLSEFTTYL